MMVRARCCDQIFESKNLKNPRIDLTVGQVEPIKRKCVIRILTVAYDWLQFQKRASLMLKVATSQTCDIHITKYLQHPSLQLLTMPSRDLFVSLTPRRSSSIALMPLVVASVAIATYARATSHHHGTAKTQELEVFHQHLTHAWKGTR